MKCTLPFEPCSSICVSGQTGSGKTRWVYRFLTHIRNMYSRDPPCQILYCYGIYQPLFDEMERTLKNFRSKQGLPSSEELEEFTGTAISYLTLWGRHLGSHAVGAAILDLTSWGPPSWCLGGRHLRSDVVGAAILDQKSWGSPSWTGSDVIGAKPAPILLRTLETIA